MAVTYVVCDSLFMAHIYIKKYDTLLFIMASFHSSKGDLKYLQSNVYGMDVIGVDISR